MRDVYMLAISAPGCTDENTVVYSYAESVDDAYFGMELATFLPEPEDVWERANFFRYLADIKSNSPGHHAVYGNFRNRNPKSPITHLFALHLIDPPEEIDSFLKRPTTIFGFDYFKNQDLNAPRMELNIITSPRYCRSPEIFGPISPRYHFEYLSEEVLGRRYDDNGVEISVVGIAGPRFLYTVSAPRVSVSERSSPGSREFYFGRMPNINKENLGLMILNPPEGFSL